MALQPIAYRVEDRTFTGYLADGSGGAPAAGVLVAHEGPGLTRHTLAVAERLAALGHVAFALDLYGERDLSLERARELGTALRRDPQGLRRRVEPAFMALRAMPHVDPARLAAIGYCLGGLAVLELARTGADLRAVVGFHPGLTPGTAAENAAIRARVLVCVGDEDPYATQDQRGEFATAMRAARVDWQMLLLGGVQHSFTNPDIDAFGLPGLAYDARAERRSWAAMRALFDEVLAPAGA